MIRAPFFSPHPACPALGALLLLLSVLAVPAVVQAERPSVSSPALVPPVDVAAVPPSCDPTITTEGSWLALADDFALRGHTIVHDTVRDRLVAFGGTEIFNRGPGVRDGT